MKFSAPSSIILALATISTCQVKAFLPVLKPTLSTSLHNNSVNKDKSVDTPSPISPKILPQDVTSETATVATPFFLTGGESKSIEELPLGVRLTGGKKLRREGLTGKGIKVAVIDDGIAASHPGFDEKVVLQTWFQQGPIGPHGTHVAGTIHMMAPDADIHDYRVMDNEGQGGDTIIAKAIREAVADGCDIINMSISGKSKTNTLRRAMGYASYSGVIMVCAAGNKGDGNPLTNEISFPASFEDAISVAAISKKDNLPVASFSESNDQVDYAGIGVGVLSFKPDGNYQRFDGTSMASPHVCGLIAALMTKDATYSEIIKDDSSLRKVLNENFCIDIGTKGRDNATGVGFLTYLTKEEFEGDFMDLPDHE